MAPIHPWTGNWTPAAHAAVRLFCLPYAGGSASAFRHLERALPTSIDLCPIQMPGRGCRWREPPIEDVRQLSAAIVDGLQDWLEKPFAFFGHSMGALVAFEAAHQLRRKAGPQPVALFASGCNAAHHSLAAPIAALPDAELLEHLRDLGGTPAEALSHPELVDLYLPVVRADLRAAESYAYVPEAPLACAVVAFAGDHDPETDLEFVRAWGELTTGHFTLHAIPGDHFFVHSSASAVAASIVNALGAEGCY